jgi:hypothetical protein
MGIEDHLLPRYLITISLRVNLATAVVEDTVEAMAIVLVVEDSVEDTVEELLSRVDQI